MNPQVYRAFFSLTICLVLVGVTTAQRRTNAPHRLDRSKPTVYLTFNSTSSNNRGDLFGLELHNNSPWKIICYLTPGKTNAGAVPVIYKVQDDKRNEVYSNHSGDVVFQRTVLPGRSVPFVVAKENLKRGYTVFVEFNYHWEIRNGISPYGVEPNHRVFFGWYDLPKLATQ